MPGTSLCFHSFSFCDWFSIIFQLEKGEKTTNFSAESGISKQQVSDIHKQKEKIMKFAANLETSKGLRQISLKVTHNEQLNKALYAWFPFKKELFHD